MLGKYVWDNWTRDFALVLVAFVTFNFYITYHKALPSSQSQLNWGSKRLRNWLNAPWWVKTLHKWDSRSRRTLFSHLSGGCVIFVFNSCLMQCSCVKNFSSDSFTILVENHRSSFTLRIVWIAIENLYSKWLLTVWGWQSKLNTRTPPFVNLTPRLSLQNHNHLQLVPKVSYLFYNIEYNPNFNNPIRL